MFSRAEINQALAHLRGGGNFGKIVIVDDDVKGRTLARTDAQALVGGGFKTTDQLRQADLERLLDELVRAVAAD